MAKLSLTDTSSGYQALSVRNANNTLIEAAIENTLSRDGTAPNTMEAALDMNSYAINNLPNAASAQQPVTLGQASSLLATTNVATQESIGALLYPQTSAEVSAGVTPTNYQYPECHVDRYVTNTTPGTTDCTTGISNAVSVAEQIGGGTRHAYIEFSPGETYLISSKITVTSISIRGNGARLLSATAITMLEINGNYQVFDDLHLEFSSLQSSASAVGVQFTDGTQQASKNTYRNIIVRNAYTAFYNNGGTASNGSIWGSVFINCRSAEHYDYGWYFDCALGATTLTFINCHAAASTSSAQGKGFYIKNGGDVNIINGAADNCAGGQALEVSTCYTLSIDEFAIENCTISTSAGWFVNTVAVNNARFGTITTKTCTYNPGAGNDAYIYRCAGGTSATVDSIIEVSPTVTSGTAYKMRTNSSTRVSTCNVPLSDVDTLGYYEFFFDVGRFKGLSHQTPTGNWTGTYEIGDVALNRSPSAGESFGWICTVAGTPGTWVPFGAIQAGSAYTPTNVSTDRAFDADTVLVAELADVVGTLIADLQGQGVLK